MELLSQIETACTFEQFAQLDALDAEVWNLLNGGDPRSDLVPARGLVDSTDADGRHFGGDLGRRDKLAVVLAELGGALGRAIVLGQR